MKKFWGYIKAFFRKKSEEIKDPEIELEQAIYEARQKDQQLRNQAAQVIAHRTQTAAKLEKESVTLAESRELAKQALLKADASQKAGDAAAVTKWTSAAQSIAMKMQASQSNVDTLTTQLQLADQQAESAKKAVQVNAANLQEMSAKQMQLKGQLEAAKMQEKVNEAMAALNATVGEDAPSLEEIENKIQARMAQASAKAELAEATPEGAMAELKASNMQLKADMALDSLRAELGLTSAAELPAAPAGELTAGDPPPADTPPAS